MNPRLFDIHSHLNFPDFDNDRKDIIKRMKENDIWTICVGANKKTSQECVKLADENDNIFASVGLHPDEDEIFDDSYYRNLALNKKVVSVGECGLDYFRIKNKELRIKQSALFKKQIELALEIDKPLMVHCREAHDDVLNVLSSYFLIYNSKLRGNIHFFSGTREQAQKYFDLGFTISFAGPVTFTSQYDEVMRMAPVDKIMIETDSPFVAPAPYRGRRNEPSYVVEVARKIAKVKNISLEDVFQETSSNALRLFLRRGIV